MSNLTRQTVFWVLAFGFQIVSITRSQTVNTTSPPKVTTEVSTKDVTTTEMPPETTAVEAPTTTAATEVTTTTVVSMTKVTTIVPTELSTTTKPATVVLSTTEATQVPKTSTTTEVLTTTEVPTTTKQTSPTAAKSTTLPIISTTVSLAANQTTEVVATTILSTATRVTPDSTITTAVSTSDSACSSCNVTIEYCGEDDTCVCRPGFFRLSDECTWSRTFYTKMTISQYNGSNASLSMINDADEGKEVLTQEIISLIDLIFSQQRDYFGCVVFRLTSGSIIADIVTYFNTSTSLNETEINDVIIVGFETQNQSTIVIVPKTTITKAAFDECELTFDDCHEVAECTDTAEYFTCSCPENTTDQLQGGLDGRLCAPLPTVPETNMSTSESPLSTTFTMPADRSFLIILIVLIAVIVLLLFFACCLAWINNNSSGQGSGFHLKATDRQASIEFLDSAERNERPTHWNVFTIDIKEDDGLLNATTGYAAQVLGESVNNPYEMHSVSTPGQTSSTQDVSMADPTYVELNTIDDKMVNKIPADGEDPSVKCPSSSDPNDEGNTPTNEMDVIYAKQVPKSERPPSQKDTSKNDLASTMATFKPSGTRKHSAQFEEESTAL
ncbi:63 kDa sperm flagellar membrane protein [Holothuria leucospilota]|uniref:63 kDa sperm flagellar membrane protein n=1 Tax=Holothuria leucospilota TaxID=206669 RepID=A0A9Q1BJ54_HOLLE|nr:63 kDa sperm flagellar membrane protein [Holothuria leucospilota]